MNGYSVLIADASSIITDGLKSILNETALFSYIYKCNTISVIKDLLEDKKIDVVVLNPAMIQNNDDLLHYIKERDNNIRIIAIQYAYFDQKVLNKFDSVLHIDDSISDIKSLFLGLLIRESDSDSEQGENLTDREIDVLKLLVKGHSNKEIADLLYISIHTVISHRKNITFKTGIKSVSGLTIYAVLKSYISLEGFM